MRRTRLAFSATYWGSGAVVCRAEEDRAGPVVDQQFGEFANWSGANSFAKKLNEGLELTGEESREIIASATLALADVLQVPAKLESIWKKAPVVVAAERLLWRSVHAQLDLAMTFCNLIDSKADIESKWRILEQIHKAIDTAIELAAKQENKRDLEMVCAKLLVLEGWRKGEVPVEWKKHQTKLRRPWEDSLAPGNL